MKKVLSLLLAAVMIVSMFAGLQITSTALATIGKCGVNVSYTFDESTGKLTISGIGLMNDYDYWPKNSSPFYNQSDIKTVVINTGVTTIGNCLFQNCSSLTSVTIPNSVKSIGEGAFAECVNLKSIINSNSITSIGKQAFCNCKSLTNITIPDSISNIGSSAFYGCSGLTSFKIPSSITSIGSFTFEGCSGLTSITIPNSVTSIGDSAFSRCKGLTNITIPNSITSIANYLFQYCSSLTSVSISKTVTSIGHYAFKGCSALTNIIIPNSVTSISKSAFSDCSSLTSITIPNSVTSIDAETFSGCSSLTSIAIPNSVTSIGRSAFSGCSGLINITIPDSVKSFGWGTFNNCSNLTNITIPDSVISIESSLFSGCSSLKNITIPNSVTIIDHYAFNNCTGLTSIILPDSVTRFAEDTFFGCTSLTSITIKNLTCEIKRDYSTIPYNTVIYGYTGSTAQEYAETFNRTFIALDAEIDNTKPLGIIESTNNVAASQTVTLTLSDNKAVDGYYWGTNSNYSSNTYTTASAGNITKTISSAGTYYLTVTDTSGNISDTVSITYYKTTLNANSGSVSPTSVLTQSGKSFTFPTPTRSGYTYQGWSTSSSATSGVNLLTPNSNTTYYAVWKQNEVPDTTKPTGSISSTNNVAASQTATLTLSDNKGVAGYYWGTNSNYASNTYTTASAGNITKTISSSGTYYLVVKDTAGNASDTVSITYYKTTLNANSGSVSPTSILTKSGNSFTFPTPTRSDYTYIGWSTSSTATSGIKTISPNSNTTYYAIWEKNIVKNPFAWGRDNWGFTNSSYSGYFASGPYRNQINVNYQNVLKNNLTNSEYQYIFKGTSYSEAWLDKDWGGSCYGMSATTLLAKAGFLPYSSYQLGANNLYQLKAPTVNGIELPLANANVSSLITYYQMLQVKNIIQQQYRSVPYKSNKENITNLISLLDKNDVVLVGFKKKDWGGHAILAYGYEYGSYSKNGITYQGRIKICDPNHSSSNSDNYYIYFNTNSYNWAIPAYASAGIYSTKGAVFNYIGASVGDINQGGYLSGSANATTSENYIARIDALEISNNRSIVKVVNNNGNYANHSSAPGEIVEDYSYILGGESKGTVGYNLYDSDAAYKVSQEEPTDLALTMDYDDCLLTSSSKAGESIVFDKEGVIQLESEAADYSVGMTYDKDYPTDWFAIEVEGENANQVSLEKEKNGWILEGDNLQNVKVSTNNKSDEAITYFTTEYDSVLIYEVDVNTIGIRVDTDDNGTYETDVKTTDYRPYHMQYNVPALVDENIYLTIKSNQYEYSTMADNGMFELDSIRGDVYRVFAKQKNSLTVCLGDYDTADGEVTNYENVVLPLGDINGDGVIDIADISILLSAQNYGTINTDIDLTGDGNISIEDIAVTLQESNYTKTSAVIL